MSAADRDYFKRRAEEERARAEFASSPAAAEVHRALAAKYDSLVMNADDGPVVAVAELKAGSGSRPG
jgi:hypothetical protein